MAIIAECGQNHFTIGEALQLLHLAHHNGADLVKFQLFDSTLLYKEHNPSELTFREARSLYELGEKMGIEVFFSVFDLEKVDWCEEIGVKRYKIAACSFPNKASVVKAVWETGKPVIFSVANGTPAEVMGELSLYCIPEYPTRIEDIDWDEMAKHDGFSDHTIGLDAAKKALERGNYIIEKHFCFSHDYGTDAEWGMTPEELKELVEWEKQVVSVPLYNQG